MKKKKKNKSDKKPMLGSSKSSKKANKKNGLGGLGGLTNGQKVAGGAALVAALGLGYWAQRRRSNAGSEGSSATGAEQQLATMQTDAT